MTGNKQTNQWEIGSDSGRDIVIPDEGVSAFHAKLVNESDRWKLIDQMSANGTWVNKQKSNVSYLQSGDRLRFAGVECQVALPNAKARKGKLAISGSDKKGSSSWLTAGLAFIATLAVIYGLMQWFG